MLERTRLALGTSDVETLLDSGEYTPLLPEQVDQLERLLQMQPEAVQSFFSGTLGGAEVTLPEAEGMVERVRVALTRPAATAARFEAMRRPREPQAPPPGFTFDSYDPATLPIDINRHDFEDDDWLGYAIGGGLNAVLHHAGVLPLGPLRRHSAYPSRFEYALDAAPGGDLPLALLADFANGYYHSRYIARGLERARYPYVIHLGDVYYGGSQQETRAYLAQPLAPVLSHSELFLLAGNHEMYAKGRPWLAYIDGKRGRRQRQEGTYFRLLRPGFQLLGIDTEWHGHSRFRDEQVVRWLRECLAEGRAQQRMNILLSSNEPYTYGKEAPTALYRDLQAIIDARLVDLWFWGNTHYGALFSSSQRFPFVGCCIGHSGYPYARLEGGKPSPAPVRFIELGSRFGDGDWPDPRPDRGNNGFCELTLLASGGAQLRFVDWRGRERYRTRVLRSARGELSFL